MAKRKPGGWLAGLLGQDDEKAVLEKALEEAREGLAASVRIDADTEVRLLELDAELSMDVDSVAQQKAALRAEKALQADRQAQFKRIVAGTRERLAAITSAENIAWLALELNLQEALRRDYAAPPPQLAIGAKIVASNARIAARFPELSAHLPHLCPILFDLSNTGDTLRLSENFVSSGREAVRAINAIRRQKGVPLR